MTRILAIMIFALLAATASVRGESDCEACERGFKDG